MYLIDPLESRLHLSITLTNGVLKVVGTKKLDIITVSFVDAPAFGVREVVVTTAVGVSELKKFPLRSVKKVEVRAGAQDDVVQIDAKKVPVFCDLGGGRDRYTHLGTGTSTVLGGSGEDSIMTGNGPDSVDGGAGGDEIDTMLGKDTITGGSGVDNINGGGGDDLLLMRDSAGDVLSGGDGNDRARADATEIAIDSIETLL